MTYEGPRLEGNDPSWMMGTNSTVNAADFAPKLGAVPKADVDKPISTTNLEKVAAQLGPNDRLAQQILRNLQRLAQPDAPAPDPVASEVGLSEKSLHVLDTVTRAAKLKPDVRRDLIQRMKLKPTAKSIEERMARRAKDQQEVLERNQEWDIHTNDTEIPAYEPVTPENAVKQIQWLPTNGKVKVGKPEKEPSADELRTFFAELGKTENRKAISGIPVPIHEKGEERREQTTQEQIFEETVKHKIAALKAEHPLATTQAPPRLVQAVRDVVHEELIPEVPPPYNVGTTYMNPNGQSGEVSSIATQVFSNYETLHDEIPRDIAALNPGEFWAPFDFTAIGATRLPQTVYSGPSADRGASDIKLQNNGFATYLKK